MRKAANTRRLPKLKPAPLGKLNKTRAAISEAALLLFEKRGFEDVTVDDIASSSGLSRRTVFRHYPAKSDIVFEPVSIGFRALPDGLLTQPSSLPIGQALANSLDMLIDGIEARRDVFARHLKIIMQSHALRATSRMLTDAAIADLRAEITARIGRTKGAPIMATIWAEMMFVIAFGARDRWLFNPSQKIAPIIAESMGHIVSLGHVVPWAPGKQLAS